MKKQMTPWVTFCVGTSILGFTVVCFILTEKGEDPFWDVIGYSLVAASFPAGCALIPFMWRFLLARISELSAAIRGK